MCVKQKTRNPGVKEGKRNDIRDQDCSYAAIVIRRSSDEYSVQDCTP